MENQVRALESIQALLLGAIAVVGSAASMAVEPTIGAALVTGAAAAGTSVASGIFANLLQAKLRELNARWAAGRGVVLNHDLQRAFFRALRAAARQTLEEYRRQFPYDRAEADARFPTAVDESCSAAGKTWTNLGTEASERLQALLEDSRRRQGWTNEAFFAATPMVDALLIGKDGTPQCSPGFARFVRTDFVARVELHFWEELKRDTAAWRAWMRGNLDIVVAHLDGIKEGQELHGAALSDVRDGLQKISDAIERGREDTAELVLLRTRMVEAVEPRLLAIVQQSALIREDVTRSLTLNEEILAKVTHLVERTRTESISSQPHQTSGNTERDRPAPNSEDVLACFAPPVYSPSIARPELESELTRRASCSPVIHVVGVPGCGKGAVVASYLEALIGRGEIDGVVWHEPDRAGGETLDALLAKVSAAEPLHRMSPSDQAKQFLSRAARRKQVVVINGLQFTEQRSYLPLINAAARLPTPVRLILIGTQSRGVDSGFPTVPELEIAGFSIDQLGQYLVLHGVENFSRFQIEELHRQTEGLPEAARAVVELVRGLGWTPESVIRDGITSPRRFQHWLEKIASSLRESEQRLLRLLSVCMDTFNAREFEVLCRLCGEPERDSSALLEVLQRRFLLRRQSPHRWRLHAGLANLHRQELTGKERGAAATALAEHAGHTARRLRAFSGEQAFVWHQRAARYRLVAHDPVNAARQISQLKSTAKSLGYYDVFLNLCRDIPLETMETTDRWLLYDYAHCCLITGRVEEAVPAISRLASRQELEPDLSVSAVRLYAEMLVEVGGDLADGLAKMREVISRVGTSRIRPNVLSHAITVEVRLLTLLGRFDEAEDLVRHQIKGTDEIRSIAVAFTGWAIICERTRRFEFADELSARASRLFAEFGRDKRGQAWSLSVRAFCALRLGKDDAARRHLAQALHMKRDIGEVSREYGMFLERAAAEFRDGDLQERIAAEMQRVAERQRETSRIPVHGGSRRRHGMNRR